MLRKAGQSRNRFLQAFQQFRREILQSLTAKHAVNAFLIKSFAIFHGRLKKLR